MCDNDRVDIRTRHIVHNIAQACTCQLRYGLQFECGQHEMWTAEGLQLFVPAEIKNQGRETRRCDTSGTDGDKKILNAVMNIQHQSSSARGWLPYLDSDLG